MSRDSLPPLEDDFSRALLGSAEADGPSNAAYAKAAAALGIGVGLGVGASLPAPAAVAVGAAGAAGVARWSSSLLAKLLALGASGALLVGAGALLLRGAAPASPTIQTAHAPVAGVAPSRAALAAPASTPSVRCLSALPLVPPLVSPVRPNSAVATSAEPVLPTAVVRPFVAAPPGRRIARGVAVAASSGHAAPTRVASGSSLSEQVQSLDRARVALSSGDSAATLREIVRYRATWPDGVFLTEASVLEIEALAARGERSLARVRAADFVAAHPDSPQAERLRALIPDKNPR